MGFQGYNTTSELTLSQDVFNYPEYVVEHLDEADTLNALSTALLHVARALPVPSFMSQHVPNTPNARYILFFWYSDTFYFLIVNKDGSMYAKEIESKREIIRDYVFTPTVMNLSTGLLSNLEDLLPR